MSPDCATDRVPFFSATASSPTGAGAPSAGPPASAAMSTFIPGSPTLPNAGCTNGTLTFVALTLRSAERIAARLAVLAIALCLASIHAQDWPHYGGDSGAAHYSALDQINRANVANLKQIWE